MMREGIRRGLTEKECRRLIEAPRSLPMNATDFQMWKSVRDELFLRMLYECFPRICELISADVADIDFEEFTLYIRHPKGKAIFRNVNGKRVHVDTIHEERATHFSDYTRNLAIRYLRGRRRGPIFTDSKGRRLTVRQGERIVHKYAEVAGIQRVVGQTKDGRKTHLASPKGLREAGERHTDVAGGDRDATARIAGHTVQTKEKYYKKGDFEEDRRVVREHHPMMREESED